MSEIMFNEVPGYKKEDWREYSRHNDKEIAGFFGEYRWLSNFDPHPVCYKGKRYSSIECAYQSAKYGGDDFFLHCTPYEAKKYCRTHKTIYPSKEWNELREFVMMECVFSKFLINLDLRVKLLETSDKYLEETNAWKDTFWGVCKGIGENRLGIILMATRYYFKNIS
jgi:ribA/ribD-fused uncharacterized protein